MSALDEGPLEEAQMFHVKQESPGARERERAGRGRRPRRTWVQTALRVSLAWVLAVLLVPLSGCETSRGAAPPPPSFWRGERQTSPSLKASNARPTPGDDAAHPLSSDRFGIDQEIERRRDQHRSRHGEGSLRFEGFSHPACAGVEGKRRARCPLLAVRWGKLREHAGGIELELLDQQVDVAELRREMLCHLALGRIGEETACPLHLEGVQVRSSRRGSSWIFQITAEGKERVVELRARMRGLFR